MSKSTKPKWYLGEAKISYKTDEALLIPSMDLNVRNSSHSAQMFRHMITDDVVEHHEEFWVCALSRSNRPIAYTQVSSGGLYACVVDIRQIMQMLILSNASSFMVCHNHPSGATEPSDEDIKLTKNLKSSGEIMGISMLDHIILTKHSYTSLADRGLM
jgi:DNA repair protein RadC